MREIGMLVINHMLNEENQSAVWDCYLPLKDWEKQVCGHDHTVIGSKLLQMWGFPPAVCVAVRDQWTATVDPSFLQTSLKLASHVLSRTGCDFGIPIEDWGQFDEYALALDFSKEMLADCVGESVSKFQRLKAAAV